MVMERLEAAKQLRGNQTEVRQFAIDRAIAGLQAAGVIDPGPLQTQPAEAVKPAEIDLAAEWRRQFDNFVARGFHNALGMSREQYLESLPQFAPQPESYASRFSVPMLVETRIAWDRQAQMADIQISDFLRERINKIKPFDKRSQPPKFAYAGWFNEWGQRFPDPIAPFTARQQLAADEVGIGPFEGIVSEIHHPEVTKSGKYSDLIGYSVGSGRVPNLLRRWDDRPGLVAYLGGYANHHWRPRVRGSEIVIGE